MASAGWHAADRITLASGWRDAASVLLDRPYPSAPDEHAVSLRPPAGPRLRAVRGPSPRRRHHVRLWQSGGSTWIGAATFDRSVGVSRFTGEVMHHIEPDIDSERRTLFEDLRRAGRIARVDVRPAERGAIEGRNGGGDRYRTDGRLWTGVLGRSRRLQVRTSAAGAVPISK